MTTKDNHLEKNEDFQVVVSEDLVESFESTLFDDGLMLSGFVMHESNNDAM
ncbi:hypothetical protein ACFFUP_01905 [Vibrio ostreicida]|uniref:Uncharacterized protein n=1 Tax=Vibrio ostreicida TaxID=526588 RepID=A0ABT8BTF6_9VIBR|nr:hypothetical protein [Vibrio ostreicida]MDN3610442.1 hypothetical protein [Vibrio ostreicida]NPD07554.1 hypothetical protein [Vibrio ostreicida]